ncbi:amino acid transporter [Mycobacteroides abscessus subsp. abscessus]|nr:amino acid transporter [Mycobacteroides abscessus subsp. abscessus]
MTTSSSELKRSLSMSQLIFMGLVFIGPRTGYIACWMILLDYVLVPSIAFMIAGIGMAFCAMVGQAAGARIILDMSRSGQLLTALSKVNAKRQVPSLAVIVVAICSIGVSLWTSTRPDGLDLLSSLVNMGALVAFVLLHASVIGYYLVRQKASVRGHMQGEGHLRVALSFFVLDEWRATRTTARPTPVHRRLVRRG